MHTAWCLRVKWTGNVAHIKEVKYAEKTSDGDLDESRPHRELWNVAGFVWFRIGSIGRNA